MYHENSESVEFIVKNPFIVKAFKESGLYCYCSSYDEISGQFFWYGNKPESAIIEELNLGIFTGKSIVSWIKTSIIATDAIVGNERDTLFSKLDLLPESVDTFTDSYETTFKSLNTGDTSCYYYCGRGFGDYGERSILYWVDYYDWNEDEEGISIEQAIREDSSRLLEIAQSLGHYKEGEWTSLGDIDATNLFGIETQGDVCVPYGTTRIPFEFFCENEDLTSVDIPDTVKSIGSGAFCACSSLKTLILPESVEEIGNSAFSFCEELECVSIPHSLKCVGITGNIFLGCTKLYDKSGFVVIDGNLFTMDDRIQFLDTEDDVIIEIPMGVKKVWTGSVIACGKRTTIIFPNTVEEICTAAVIVNRLCEELNIVIPSSVVKIDDILVYSQDHCNVKISSQKGSYAEKYVKMNGINYGCLADSF